MNGLSLLRCMCDETRFEILTLLQNNGELCVGDFVTQLQRDQPLISHHLKQLRECKIIKSRSEGKKVIYAISNKQLSKLIADITITSKKIPTMCSESCC